MDLWMVHISPNGLVLEVGNGTGPEAEKALILAALLGLLRVA